MRLTTTLTGLSAVLLHTATAAPSPTVVSDAKYEFCDSGICVKKYFTITSIPVTHDNAVAQCQAENAFYDAWCPESEQEAKDVYVNIVANAWLKGSTPSSFAEDDLTNFKAYYGTWTGLKSTASGASIDNSNLNDYTCAATAAWNKTFVASPTFATNPETDINKKCVSIGEGYKVNTVGITGNPYNFRNQKCDDAENKKHAICQTTLTSLESDASHTAMDSAHVILVDQAFAETIKPTKKKDDNNLAGEDVFTQAIILLPIVVIGTIWAVGRPIKGREVGWSLR
jgi:hypothetical protein